MRPSSRAEFCTLVISFLLAFGLQTSAIASPKGLLAGLDNVYYYPDKQGLRQVSAIMQIEQLDASSRKQNYFKLPSLRIRWSAENGKATFSMLDEGVEEESAKYVLELVGNFGEMLFPATLAEQLKNYKGKIKERNKKAITVEYKAENPQDNIREYKLSVDPAKRRIKTMQILQNNGPAHINIKFAYTSHEGKWRIEESQAQFESGGYDFVENTRFNFVKTDKYWLVGKIIHKLTRNGTTVQSYILTLDSMQVN